MKIEESERVSRVPRNWTDDLQNEWTWETHVYGLAISWFILGLYTFIAAINLRSGASYKRILNRICGYLCLAAIMRAMYLLIDPYETKMRLEPWISRILYVTVQPILLMVFLLAFGLLLKFTGIRLRPTSLENTTFLQFFALAICTAQGILETGVHFFAESVLPILVLIEFFYVCFHCFVTVAYMHYGIRMIRKLRKQIRGSQIKCYNLKRGDPHGISNLSLPKIRITDENECSMSYRSEMSSFHSISSGPDNPEENVRLSPANGDAAAANGETVSPSGSSGESGSPGANAPRQNGSRFSAVLGKSRGKKRQRKRRPRDQNKPDLNKLPRTRRLRGLIRGLYFAAFCGLIQCAWLCYERLGRTIGWDHLAGNAQAWFVVQTIFRVTELLWAGSIGYAVRHGFNRL